jgi:hypothetical protein
VHTFPCENNEDAFYCTGRAQAVDDPATGASTARHDPGWFDGVCVSPAGLKCAKRMSQGSSHHARTSSRRHKGCQLCKPWKLARHGDAYTQPPSAVRQLGARRARKISRHDVGDQDR